MCGSDPLMKKMPYMCDDAKSNLCRLINIEEKNHEDKLRFEVKARLTELKLSENMMKFQKYIDKNADKYLELSIEQQIIEFGKVWLDCFGSDNKTDEEGEINEIFDKTYSIFHIESESMETKNNIHTLFYNYNFEMDEIIQIIEKYIFSNFINGPEQFIFQFKVNKPPLKEMTPYPGKASCEYLSKDILASLDNEQDNHNRSKFKVSMKTFYSGCQTMIQQFSGYYNDPDIRWKTDKKQILLLASRLRDPNNHERSSWVKFINNITKGVTELIEKGLNISHSTIKEIVNFLCEICKVINYELNFIEARLTNTAERKLTTYAFSLVFKSLLDAKFEKEKERKEETEKKKESDLSYFLQKIENRKMTRGNWDRQTMRKGDTTIANKFAGDLLEALLRSVYTECERTLKEQYFDERVDLLSHKILLLLANNRVAQELKKDRKDSLLSVDNFVVEFICNRKQTLEYLFQEKWLNVAGEIHDTIIEKMRKRFLALKSTVETVLNEFLNDVLKECERLDLTEEIGLDSDSNFVVVDLLKKESSCTSDLKTKEAPFKAMVLFLEMYLNPNVSPEEFDQFFNNPFQLDGILMEKNQDTYVLCRKTSNTRQILDEASFKKFSEMKMFSNTETIFNIRIYVDEFLHTLTSFGFQVSQNDYEKLLKSTKEEFESRVINCPNQCPSCGKFCEREIHPNDGKCRILTGHQICSMGGKVWNANKDKTAILLMCEDYRDELLVLIPGQNMKWSEFKEKCEDQWDWTLPQDDVYVTLQKENRAKIQKIWAKFGKAILDYYSNKGTHINYIPYTSPEEIYKSLFTLNSYVCFVIDGTKLMSGAINCVKHWVSEHMKILERVSNFRVVVYHGCCLSKDFIETFPKSSNFILDESSIQDFLENMTIYGDQNDEFALLHGLAAAVKGSNWKTGFEIRNTLVHMYLEPTTGSYQAFRATGNCTYGCAFNWKKDIKKGIQSLRINYKRVRLINCDHPDFHLGQPITYENKVVDLSSEKKFKSEVFINYNPDS